jgi:hypothetical protein
MPGGIRHAAERARVVVPAMNFPVLAAPC